MPIDASIMTKHDSEAPHCHHEFRGGVCMKCGYSTTKGYGK